MQTAHSVVEIGTTYRVTHTFTPAPESPNLYEILVTLENISASPVDAVYRRVMDWDVEPTAFDDFVTIGGASDLLLESTNDGFAHPDPLRPATDLGQRGTFTDVGPDDHGALFDFGFGTVEPGEAVQFRLYYGAAPNEDVAEASIEAVGAEVWSFGQPNTPDGPTLGTPNTFIFGFAAGDYCAGEELVTVAPSGVAGEPQVTVEYEPRFAAPASFELREDIALRAAQEIQDRAVASIVAYEGQGFDMPDALTIKIPCEYPSPEKEVLGVFGLPPAFTRSDSLIYILAHELRQRMQPAVEAHEDARRNGDELPARGLANADTTPAAEWVSLIDHELAHTWQYREYELPTDLWLQLAAMGRTVIESGAVVSQDLLPDADDLQAPVDGNGVLQPYAGSYLLEVEDLFSEHTGLNGDPYDSAAILQFWGERFGEAGHADLEDQVAAFLERLTRLDEAGLLAMNAAIAACPGADCPDLFDALRDFYTAAYVLDADNVTTLTDRGYEVLDSAVAHGDITGPGGGQPSGGQRYPSFELAAQQAQLIAGGTVSFASQSLAPSAGAAYEVAIPAGVTTVTVDLDTSASALFDAGLMLAAVPRGADGNAVIDRAFMRSAQRPFSDGASFDVPVSPGGRLGLVLVGTQPLFLAPALTDANFALTVSDANATLAAAILPPTASDAHFDPSRSCTELTIAVDVTSGSPGSFYPGLPDDAFSVSLDGTPLTLAPVWQRDDSYVLFADYAGPLSNEDHTVTVNVRGATDSYTISPAPATDPAECDAIVLAEWEETVGLGETATVTADVSAAASFRATATWQGSDYDLVLTSPSGRSIGEGSTDPDVSVAQGGNTVSITVADAEVGEWQLGITGVDLPDGPEVVSLTAVETAPAVRADLSLANTGGAGTPIAVEFALRDVSSPVANAAAVARVTDPDGTVRSFPMTDAGSRESRKPGDGVYTAQLWATDVAGSYTVVVQATGTRRDGSSFIRFAEDTLLMGPKTDTDGDGVADAAEVLFGADPADATDGAEDVDGDGRSLAAELAAGLDPFSWDTDGGGESDASEIAAGREPRLAEDDTAIPGVIVTATPTDGGTVTVTLIADDPAASIQLSRLPATGPSVDLGVHPGTGATISDGPLPAGAYQYRAVLTSVAGAQGAPAYSPQVQAGDDVTPPSARLVLEGDRWVTNEASVRVFFSGLSEPVAEMRLASSEAALADTIWAPFASTTEVSIGPADGKHRIYAQLRDQAGNISLLMESDQLTLDTIQPSSSVGALPATTPDASLSVPFTATDEGTGLSYAELWLRHRPAAGAEWGLWTMVATGDLSPFTIGLPFGEGSYEFYTIGVDIAGNREVAPASADAATTYGSDTAPPVSQAGPLSAVYTSSSVDVPYTASDDASGVASVELWSRYRANLLQAWSPWSLGPVGSASPISYPFGNGDGHYEFYTVGIDVAGNREAPPAAADAATRRDATDDPPAMTFSASATGNGSNCQPGRMCFSATDGGRTRWINGSGRAVDDRGVARVEYRLFGVKSDGTRRQLHTWQLTTPLDGGFGGSDERFELGESASKTYETFEIEIRALDTAGLYSPTITTRFPVFTCTESACSGRPVAP